MRQRNRLLNLTTIALLALLPLAAFAEPGFGHRDRGPGRGMFPPPDYLDLTDEQLEAAEAIRESVRAEMGATRDQQRSLREQLKAALDGDNPDAATVGQMVIDMHALRAQGRAVMAEAEGRFAALLDAEQREKWENFKQLRENRRGPRHRGGPGGRFGGGPGFGLGGGPRG